ncbi:MAG: OadG family protein [Oscillospiraceae bacterium]|nr:OadG family protein [Oscillospiraceae bacterium]
MNLHSILSTVSAEAEAPGVIDRLQSYVGNADQTIAQQQLADPDYWSSVGIITITGLLVVFLILGILIFIFWGMGQFFKSMDKRKAQKAEAAKAAEAVKTVAPVAVVEDAAEEDVVADDDEIIAVISAAIAAYSEADGKQYEIRSIRRKDSRTRSAWSLAGIGENTRPF